MKYSSDSPASSPPETRSYDFLVAGGGIGGCIAAIAAARHGLKTVLVQDRPVLGGNASSEINVLIAGANAMDYNPHARETGIIEEILVETSARSANRSARMLDDVLWEWTAREPNLEVFLNTQVTGTEMDSPTRLAGVHVLRNWSESRLLLRARYFADCTGDAVLAHAAGARWRMGREARSEFGESLAPETADHKTLGCTLPFQYRDAGHPVDYTPPPFARDFSSPDSFPERHHTLPGNHFWWVEWGGELDCIHQYQEIKDELTKVVYGVWDHIKNHGEHGAENYALIRVGHLLGKRESRRVEGDYMLTENDLVSCRRFDDAVAYGGWPIDLHPPEGVYSREAPAVQTFVTPYDIPFRCLYSRDVENLFLVGRDVSVSHVALGSTRVMGTIATMGQAVGTAAALCHRQAIAPRELASSPLANFQQQLLRDDAYLVGRPNTDPADLARSACITASSDAPLHCLEGDDWKPLAQGCAQIFPITTGRLDQLEIELRNESAEPAAITLQLFPAGHLYDFSAATPFASASAVIPPSTEGWISFPFESPLPRGLYCVRASFTENVFWRRSTLRELLGTKTGEWNPEKKEWFAYRGHHRVDTATWIPFRGCHTFRLAPETRPHAGSEVVNGFSRPLDWPNLWMSNPAQPMPQSLTLELSRLSAVGEICLTFDTDLDHRVPPRFCPQCVRDYDVHLRAESGWQRIEKVRGNYHRRRIHRGLTEPVGAVRIEVLATNGDPSARIFEVRLYASPSSIALS